MESLKALFEGCRTYRRFRQEPVPQALIHEMCETARTRSCAANAQKLRFLAISTPEEVAKVQPHVHWAAKLPKEIGTPKADEAPTAFIIVLVPARAGEFVHVDEGIALDAMAITAWQQQAGSCILKNIDRAELNRIFTVPEGYTASSVLAVGYPRHTSTLVTPDNEHGLDYYVDTDRNYYVPKLPSEEVIRYL